jgi:hypothetical protein
MSLDRSSGREVRVMGVQRPGGVWAAKVPRVATKRVWSAALALVVLTFVLAALVTGCAVTVGPTQEFVIEEPLGGAAVTDIVVKMGAGSLSVQPGASGLVSGVIRYNVAEWKPVIKRGPSRISIEQGSPKGVSVLGGDVLNRWELRLGKAPLRLEVEAGAYEGEYELGGLTLSSLKIKDGAAKTKVTFSEANPGLLERFIYETGASSVSLAGLANANFALLEFKGGAGSYTLDFSGELRSDGRVRIKAGVGKVRLVIPRGISVRVTVDGSLNDISTEGPWVKKDKTYTLETTGGQAGKSLDIVVEMSVGKLELAAQ